MTRSELARFHALVTTQPENPDGNSTFHSALADRSLELAITSDQPGGPPDVDGKDQTGVTHSNVMLASVDVSNEAAAAFDGQPWSTTGLLFGVDDVLDDEGRPLAERRAPSAVKTGVEIELVECPYSDSRRGSPMNVSALEQIKLHLREVFDGIRGFVAALGPAQPSIEHAHLVVIDQLVTPGVALLNSRDPKGVVSAVSAVGYKLAAGYFGVFRKLQLARARGVVIEPNVDAFLEYVRECGALVGDREVCAGPQNLLRRTTQVIFEGMPDILPCSSQRVVIARALKFQLELGVTLELLDEVAERRWLELARTSLRPKNVFIGERFTERLDILPELASEPLDVLMSLNPQFGASSGLRAGLERWVIRQARPTPELMRITSCGEGAFVLNDRRDVDQFAADLFLYIEVYRRAVGELWLVERRLREFIDAPLDTPVRFNALALPKSRTLSWSEALLGHKIHCEPAREPNVRFQRLARRNAL